MPKLADFKTTLIRSLNRLNAKTVDPGGLILGTPGQVSGAVTSLAMKGIVDQASLGKTTVTYNRIALPSFFAIPTFTILSAPTFVALLGRLSNQFGVYFDPAEFVAQGFVWTNNQTSVLLKAKPESVYWQGEITLNLSQVTIPLSEVFLQDTLAIPLGGITQDQWFALLLKVNNRNVLRTAVALGDPVTVTDTLNSYVRVSALGDTGYSGTRDIKFNRVNLATTFTNPLFVVPDDFSGDGQALLQWERAGISAVCPYTDLNNPNVDMSASPRTVRYSAIASSLAVYGSFTATVMKDSEVNTSVELVYSANASNLTSALFLAKVKAAVGDARTAKVKVTVNAGVYLVANSVSDVVFDFSVPTGMDAVEYTLVNNGFVYGRGGNGGVGTTSSATTPGTGTQGGNAIKMATVPLKVTIDNLGEICGGGGGGAGSYANNGGSQTGGGGGGGCPLGVGAATAGATATLSAAGAGGAGTGTVNTGGSGGLPGKPGNASTRANPGAAPGLVFSGDASGITWLNINRVLPLIAGEQTIDMAFTASNLAQATSVLPTMLVNAKVGMLNLTVNLSIAAGVDIVSSAPGTAEPPLDFTRGDHNHVLWKVTNRGRVMGRGGKAAGYTTATVSMVAQLGAPAGRANDGVDVQLWNYGTFEAGGGGGASVVSGTNIFGGGGGRPYGTGTGGRQSTSTYQATWKGGDATLEAPGGPFTGGTPFSGAGGDLGQAGGSTTSAGAVAQARVVLVGNGTFTLMPV